MTTTKLTIQSVSDASGIPARLIRAVIRQLGITWGEFVERADDFTQAGGGWYGFTYYADTVEFTQRNRKAIFEWMDSHIAKVGYGSRLDYLDGFKCLEDLSRFEVETGLLYPKSDERTQVYNALAWFALEEAAHAVIHARESV